MKNTLDGRSFHISFLLNPLHSRVNRRRAMRIVRSVTRRVVDRFRVGENPQHVVPSYDLRTLWVTNNAEGRTDGSLTPIDPTTGRPEKAIPADDPYNMYFTHGHSAIVVAEALKRLDFRDPQTMALQSSLEAVPGVGPILALTAIAVFADAHPALRQRRARGELRWAHAEHLPARRL